MTEREIDIKVYKELSIQDKIDVAEGDRNMWFIISTVTSALTLMFSHEVYRDGLDGEKAIALGAFAALNAVTWKMVQRENAEIDDLKTKQTWKEQIYRAL